MTRVNGETPPPLDLDRVRGVRELLSTAVALFVHHSGLFLSVTLLVVAPVVVLVDGAWGGALRDGADANPSPDVSRTSLVLLALVIPPLVTGLHAVIVRELGAGRLLRPGEALRMLAPRVPAAFGAVLLYSLGVFVGFALLVIPGIWLAMRWYFAAQSAVLDGASPRRALDASAELVKGRWWTTFFALVIAGTLFGLLTAVAQELASLVHEGVAYVTLVTVIQAVGLSLSALFGTLLFFTLRAQRGVLQLFAPAD